MSVVGSGITPVLLCAQADQPDQRASHDMLLIAVRCL